MTSLRGLRRTEIQESGPWQRFKHNQGLKNEGPEIFKMLMLMGGNGVVQSLPLPCPPLRLRGLLQYPDQDGDGFSDLIFPKVSVSEYNYVWI